MGDFSWKSLMGMPARGMNALSPEPPKTDNRLFNALMSVHSAIDPVKAFGGYGAMLGMALPAGPLKAPTGYHGSPNSFSKFDPSRSKSGHYGDAVYLHESPKDAGRYAQDKGNVYAVDANVKKTFDMDAPVSAADAERILRAAGQHKVADITRETGKGFRNGNELWYWYMGQETPIASKVSALRSVGFDAIKGDPTKAISGSSVRSPEIAVLDPSKARIRSQTKPYAAVAGQSVSTTDAKRR